MGLRHSQLHKCIQDLNSQSSAVKQMRISAWHRGELQSCMPAHFLFICVPEKGSCARTTTQPSTLRQLCCLPSISKWKILDLQQYNQIQATQVDEYLSFPFHWQLWGPEVQKNLQLRSKFYTGLLSHSKKKKVKISKQNKKILYSC